MSPDRSGYGVLPCAVMDRDDISIYAKMLYAALSSFAGLTEIRPGHKRLAEIVGCSERKIREALAELRTSELIEWKTVATQTGKISIYRNVQPWTGVRHDMPDLLEKRHEVPDGSGTRVLRGAAPGAGEVTKEQVTKEPDRFAEFYAAYPRRIARGPAVKAWKAATKKADEQTLIDAAARFTANCRGSDPGFIPYPASWLNGERWLDEAPQYTGHSESMSGSWFPGG